MNEPKTWYYYLHKNGDLIGKNPVVVDSDPEYFDSPFVKKVWKINLSDRADAWGLILEALALGARIDRVKELAAKWTCDLKDLIELFKHVSRLTELMKKGIDVYIEKILEIGLQTGTEPADH